MSKLTWVDYIALVAVLRGLYVGYKDGFFQELLRLVAYCVTLFVTLVGNEWAAQQLTLRTPLNETTSRVIAFTSLFAGSYLALAVLRAVVIRVLKLGDGGAGQKLLGAFIGGARLLLLLSFFFMLVDSTPLKELKTDVHTRSLTGPYISQAAPALYEFVTMQSTQLGIAGKPAPA